MRLPKFEYLSPDTFEQALILLSAHSPDVCIVAGGTDLLVRMKLGLAAPKYLISLKALNDLSYIEKDGESVKIGSQTPLKDIIDSELIREHAPALSMACEKIGALSIQHYRGTIGGNILQDNRCHYYNQSSFHRSGRQACHKDGGKICYARDVSDRCHSTCQSDGATALMALDAKLVLAGKESERTVPMTDFYTSDGIKPFSIEPHELLKEIIIPAEGRRSAYKRLAYRSAVDYPIVSAGVSLKISETKQDIIEEARIVVGAISRAPLYLAQESASLKGKQLSDTEAFRQVAEACKNSASTFAVHNVGSTLEYRCAMISEMSFQALQQAAL